MNKIVINDCRGGFGLLEKAIARILEINPNHPCNVKTNILSAYFNMNIERHDPVLIQVVEELGIEASAKYAKLVVTEIRSHLYRINKEHGQETVEVPDESCWNVIY